ncbi:MAG: carboxymuconolactone decarboxylase family protein [Methanomassiliicoccaceae archaeon]|nr:carboxymuconolactone decarboxylase family protein [Methanomassiliicoccaceae archaeon]
MALTKREREMVAVGASIAGNCIPCLEVHYLKCVEMGFTKDEIEEAFILAKKVKEVPNKRIYETADWLNGNKPVLAADAGGSCCPEDILSENSCCSPKGNKK